MAVNHINVIKTNKAQLKTQPRQILSYPPNKQPVYNKIINNKIMTPETCMKKMQNRNLLNTRPSSASPQTQSACESYGGT